MRRKVFFCILAGWILPLYLHGGAPLPGTTIPKSAAAEKSAVSAAARNEQGEEELSPEKMFQELNEDARSASGWFVREQSDLLNFLAGSTASILAGILLTWLARRLAKNRQRKYMHLSWRGETLHALAAPTVLLGVLISCFLFSIPVLKSLPRNLHDLDMRCFYAMTALTVAWGVFRLVSVLDRRIRIFAERNDNALDNLTVSMIGNTLKIAIGVTAVLFIGQNIFQLNITALLAGAGVIGLAFALAAKDTVSNFFGTIVIIADCPFRLGDRIRTGDVNGIVTHVGMRSSKIMTADESVYTIPNSQLTNTILCNENSKGHLKHNMDIGLTYDTGPQEMERALRILHEIMDDFHGPDPAGHAPHIFFSAFGASALNIHAVIWFKTNSFISEEELLNELNFLILKRFNEAELRIAYPTQTIYIADGSGASGGK